MTALAAVAAALVAAVAAAQAAGPAAVARAIGCAVVSGVAWAKLNDLHQAFFYVPYVHQDH